MRKGGKGSRQKELEWIITENNCHVCISHIKDKDGYIKIQRQNKCYHAHRWLYIQHYGEIPSGMVVMHACDNPSCINLNHLKLGTYSDNTQDMITKGRQNNIKRNPNKSVIIPNNIAKVRLSKGMNRHDFSNLTGLSLTQIWRLEKNKSNPRMSTLKIIAEVLNVEINELI